MTGYQFPPNLRSVPAWDRTEGRSVTVHRNDWECATACGHATVMVSTAGDTDHYYATAADLVFPDSQPKRADYKNYASYQEAMKAWRAANPHAWECVALTVFQCNPAEPHVHYRCGWVSS
jgi:hypothetical protein